MLFLTGHSGAGKTTLLKLIAAIGAPTAARCSSMGRTFGLRPAAILTCGAIWAWCSGAEAALRQRAYSTSSLLPLIVNRAALPRSGAARTPRRSTGGHLGHDHGSMTLSNTLLSEEQLLP